MDIPLNKTEKNKKGKPAHLIDTVFKKKCYFAGVIRTCKNIFGDNFAKDAKERQRAFKFLLGNRVGEIQVVQLVLGLATALEDRGDVGGYLINTNGTGSKVLLEGMTAAPIPMLGKKCSLANDTRTMSFLNAIHELIVIILKENERKTVHLRSVLVNLDLHQKSDDNSRAVGHVLVIFFCSGIFKTPEQLFIAMSRDERKNHDTSRIVDMLCEATTFKSQYQPIPVIRTDDESGESEFWRDPGNKEDCNKMAKKFLQCNLLGRFIKNEMSPGFCISTGKNSTVVALKLEVKEED